MSLSINPIGNISFKAQESKVEAKPTEKPKDPKYTDSEKVMMAMGAAAGVVLGGILVKKHLDAKSAKKLFEEAQKLVQKPKEFSYKNVRKLGDELYGIGKFQDGDTMIIMGKTHLNELAEKEANKNTNWTKLYRAMKMSDNGFAIIIKKADGKVDMDTLKYFDPEKITEPQILDSLREGKMIEMSFRD